MIDRIESTHCCTSMLLPGAEVVAEPDHWPIRSFITSSHTVLAAVDTVAGVTVDAAGVKVPPMPSITCEMRSLQFCVVPSIPGAEVAEFYMKINSLVPFVRGKSEESYIGNGDRLGSDKLRNQVLPVDGRCRLGPQRHACGGGTPWFGGGHMLLDAGDMVQLSGHFDENGHNLCEQWHNLFVA